MDTLKGHQQAPCKLAFQNGSHLFSLPDPMNVFFFSLKWEWYFPRKVRAPSDVMDCIWQEGYSPGRPRRPACPGGPGGPGGPGTGVDMPGSPLRP